MKKFLRLALCLALLPMAGLPGSAAEESAKEIVAQFYAAFSAHDIEAMSRLVSEDFAKLNVFGDQLLPEFRGRDGLKKSMTEYFTSLPDVRSEIEAVLESGNLVSVRERVHWTIGDKACSHSTLAIYQVEGGQILWLWYHPVEE